jgi:hypothetical protein
MTFAGFAPWQALLIVLAAGAAAAWIFRLKVRPPRVAVPSISLWQRVVDEQRELSWWERVRRTVSLVVTVLVAVALAVAFARPVPRGTGAATGRVLLVLDSSWSMLARTSTGETRWERAVAAARRQMYAAGGDVVLATTADGIVEGPTADVALVETALERLQPGAGGSDGWPRLGGVDAVHFFTDGATARPVDEGVVTHSVFEAAPNVAITAFAARPSLASALAAEAYLEVSNFAPRPQSIVILVTRGSDRVLERDVEVGAGEALRQVLPLGSDGDPRLRATIRAAENALAIDDEAVAWLEAAQPLDVAVIVEGASSIAPLISRVPGVRARTLAPSEYPGTPADLFVFEGWLPASAPSRPALVVGPPASEWLGTQSKVEASPAWGASRAHPVLSGVDISTLTIDRVRLSAGLTPLAESASGASLLAVQDTTDRRLVVLPFGPGDSNLLAAPAFPVLVGNALQWLGRPSIATPGQPGPRLLPASTSRVVSPAGEEVPLIRAGDHVVARLETPGLYLAETGGARSVITVNVADPAVSNLQVSSGPATDTAAIAAGWARQPWWTYAVILAFVLLTIEWWTWQRRITV